MNIKHWIVALSSLWASVPPNGLFQFFQDFLWIINFNNQFCLFCGGVNDVLNFMQDCFSNSRWALRWHDNFSWIKYFFTFSYITFVNSEISTREAFVFSLKTKCWRGNSTASSNEINFLSVFTPFRWLSFSCSIIVCQYQSHHK